MTTGVRIGLRARVLIVGAALALAGISAISGEARTSGGGTPAPASFRLADNSAGCSLLASGSLACAASGKTVILEPSGRSRVSSQAISWSPDTPVLAPAASWWHGSYSCRVVGKAIACRSGEGAISVGSRRIGGVL